MFFAEILLVTGDYRIKTLQLALQGFYDQSQTAGLIVMCGVRNILSTMRNILTRASDCIAGGKKGEKGKAQQGCFFHRKLRV